MVTFSQIVSVFGGSLLGISCLWLGWRSRNSGEVQSLVIVLILVVVPGLLIVFRHYPYVLGYALSVLGCAVWGHSKGSLSRKKV